MDHQNCSDGSIMRFHTIIIKSIFNIILNLDRLPQFVTKDNLTFIHIYSSDIVL